MYAFVHIEKTAGTTLNTILRRSFGTGHCDIRLPLRKRCRDRRDHRVCIDAADLRRVPRLYRNLRGIAGHNVKPYADVKLGFPETQFLTFLRDPAARFRSHFLNRAEGHDLEAFESWISDDWTHNWQTKMIAGEPNAKRAIELITSQFGFVGLTERFDESLVLLGQWLDDLRFRPAYRSVNQLNEKRRPRDLARQHADMSYLASERVRTWIAEVNAEDQKVYNFITTTVYPRQLAEYMGNLQLELQKLYEQNRRTDQDEEPTWSRLFRNYVYKPLLHCYLL